MKYTSFNLCNIIHHIITHIGIQIFQTLPYSTMELQKHLFLIAQKSNKSSNAQSCCTLIYVVALILGICSFGLFLFGELHLKTNEQYLATCFKDNNFRLKIDQFALIYTDRAESLMKTIKQAQPIAENKGCSMYKNLNYTNITQQSQLIITGLYSIYKMQKKQREDLKFDNYTVILKERQYLKDLIYGVPSLISNEIIRLVDSEKLSTIIDSNEIYIKASTVRIYYSTFLQNAESLITKIVGILETVFSYAVASVITSLYIYVTIISSPAVILLILKLTPYGRTQEFFQAFKAFPWIGMHSMILRASSKMEVKLQYIGICWSLIIYFLVMYMGYYTVILQLTDLLFDQPMENSVGQTLFGYFAVIEFLSLIFMRTRPFLKFFPVINALIVFFYMLYCKFSHFGFKFLAGVSMNSFGLALFSWMILNLEIPAQKTWLPGGDSFIPNIRQPRAGLIPTFNLNWANGLPDEWTMLLPLMGKQNFNRQQMSFINQQYEQLTQYLIKN